MSAHNICTIGMGIVLFIALALVSGCGEKIDTLADELEGKVELSWTEMSLARQLVWKDWTGAQHTPLFDRKPALVQILRRKGTADRGGGIKLLNTSRTKSLNHIEGVDLITRLLDNADVKPTLRLSSPDWHWNRFMFWRRQLFLVSIDPAILVITSNKYDHLAKNMHALIQDGKLPSRSLSLASNGKYPPQEGKDGPNYEEGSSVYLLDVFPDVPGTEVVSDQWKGVRTLAQMEADPAIPFKVVPAEDVPGFLSLALKHPDKTQQ